MRGRNTGCASRIRPPVHGSPRNPIEEYILRERTARDCADHFDAPYCLHGHTHSPQLFRLHEEASQRTCESCIPSAPEWFPLGRDRLLINPGSVGQPRDGSPHAGFATLDTHTGILGFHRCPYDVGRTQERMRRERLPQRLIKRLASGT
ncbi:MAG: hypothetical protein GF330_09465 [Candidatus Eisenbacteria bacterium]|nr:hypothetical protein [Candidatus Eisenbacteria bacterium]